MAVVGCGTGGPAAALLLARAGHRVAVFEQAAKPGPVGAGILLQPTGLAVLDRLGLGSALRERGAPIARVHGATPAGRTVLDLAYADLAPGLLGLGVHRGALFEALRTALEHAAIPVHAATRVTGLARDGARPVLVDESGERYGPFDLVVAADGARSPLRSAAGLAARVDPYPWGAVWAIVAEPEGAFEGMLDQVYAGTERMVGFLPTGRPGSGPGGSPTVSLFWSIRLDRLVQWRAAGLDAWKRELLAIAPRAEPLLAPIDDLAQLTTAAYYDVRMPRLHADRLALVGDTGQRRARSWDRGRTWRYRTPPGSPTCSATGTGWPRRSMATAAIAAAQPASTRSRAAG